LAEKRQELHFLRNEEKQKWIEDHVERETAGARKRDEDAEAAIGQEQEDTEMAEKAGLMAREPEKAFHEMIVAIIERLSDIASSDDEEAGDDENDEATEQGKLSDDDEPGWAMGTISKSIQQRRERF